ncbi:Type II secretion system protein F [Patescibacteria group bacterium]|nr:Type II secretion system protein F [Patescibacteria group bacterium]
MQLFFYKAINQTGVTEEGKRMAADEQSLIADLQAQGYIPIRVMPAREKLFLGVHLIKPRQLMRKDFALFINQLAVLLESGLALDRALNVLLELSEDNIPLHNFINRVLNKVKGGSSLIDAIERRKSGARPTSRVITQFDLSMIKAGEASGNLAEVLTRLATYIERSQELKNTVSTALIYPAILLVMSIASLLVMLMFVVPQFNEMFSNAGKALPVSTQIVIKIAALLRDDWWVLLLMTASIYTYFHRQLKHPETQKIWHQRFLNLPLIGNILLSKETANFSRTLGTLLNNGVALLTSLSIARETLTNLSLVEAFSEVEQQVKQGRTLSLAVAEKNCLPKMALQMIRTGEETGRLEEMLLKVADVYDKQLKITVQRGLAILEPALILTLGVMIAGIIVSILLAILSVNDLAF